MPKLRLLFFFAASLLIYSYFCSLSGFVVVVFTNLRLKQIGLAQIKSNSNNKSRGRIVPFKFHVHKEGEGQKEIFICSRRRR